jgi:hypothetical protein
MPRFTVNFDKTAFVPNTKKNRDGFELTNEEVRALSSELAASGAFPEGISGVTRVTANPDDVIRKGEDVKMFVSIDLTVEADDEDEARYTRAPGALLAAIAGRLHPELADLTYGWEVLETEPCREYVIAGATDAEGGQLFWSNAQGWVDRASADVFSGTEHDTLRLPEGGTWSEIEQDLPAPAPSA